MKTQLLAFRAQILLALISFGCCSVNGQGMFFFINSSTRIGSIDGPHAGVGIWARMLVGQTPDALSPLGPAQPYGPDGVVGGRNVTVPDTTCLDKVFIQMVAWDGRVWGSELAGVPENQLGRTDIVEHTLLDDDGPDCPPWPTYAPRFTQPAVVPLVPEPSAFALTALGGVALLVFRRHRRERL